jgi:hypothetical protein
MNKQNHSARIPGRRPQPPRNLTASQARIWRNVTATKQIGAFDAGSFPVLAAYCVLVATWEALRDPDAEAISLRELMQLTGQITRLATALRLTPQARYDPQTAHRGAKRLKGTRPWD